MENSNVRIGEQDVINAKRRECVEERRSAAHGRSLSAAGHGIVPGWPGLPPASAAQCVNKYNGQTMRALAKDKWRLPLSHHSSGCKTAHDAHKNAVDPTTLCPGGHEAEHASGRCDERMGDGEDAAAAQEALQLKRRNLEQPVVGWKRQRLAQALRAEAEYNM